MLRHSLKIKHIAQVEWLYQSQRLYYLIKSTSSLNTGKNEKNKITFDDMIADRRLQAARSILVQISSEDKSKTILRQLNEPFGGLQNCFRYKNGLNSSFLLLEYRDEFSANSVIQTATHLKNENDGLPVRSRFLVFQQKNKIFDPKINFKDTDIPVVTEKNVSSHEQIIQLIKFGNTIDDQINILYRRTCLSELAIRLRFFAALQIESSMNNIFAHVSVLPFGSSVNGFGRMGSDLDLILSLERKISSDESVLTFTEKSWNGKPRLLVQKNLELIANLMNHWLPGITNVRPILQARIPIIKSRQDILNLDVDLSMTDLSGFYMSELFYLFGEIDQRVKPLIIFVRRWAEECQITTSIVPGHWITNFSLSCLVIFFLQQLEKPILPTINELANQARPQDHRFISDEINCTFLRDLNHLNFTTTNTDSMKDIIIQFFKFCTNTKFQNNSISLNNGCLMPKTTTAPMEIVNPLQHQLNVSQNVNAVEVEQLGIKAQAAITKLQSKTPNRNQRGIIEIFENKSELNKKLLSTLRTNSYTPRTLNRIHTNYKNATKIFDVSVLKFKKTK